ncbi:K(+)/H(+) antiporter NhaP2 [Caulifigura coniformis]|uniref:K(+)/H(+) antiporter NhaP2 n=1 Tax=Caulifigura coniformis TaxID=2527983 RepID=A0A517S7L5_9PLAN|nr:sodium:proton antiporter [Caulifigura coniformis]QDT52117.1 K(+)/H(+) antiporter NhaP2 [Caulifigura coniformis]
MESVTASLVAVLVLGTGAQWLAWRLKLPSILVLLVFGFVAGPLTHLLKPDEFAGDALFPIVSLSVALILFEGGLSLKWSELRSIGKVLLGLLTIGVAVTWILATAGAWWILGMSSSVALLLGAILVVTGPTVIGPLLREIRPTGAVGPIAKWEGIVVDPIGAVLAVLVFEAIQHGEHTGLLDLGLASMRDSIATLAVGAGLGAAAAWLLTECLRRHQIPDALENPVALTLVLAAFVASNALREESGLLTVTVMGVILANQSKIAVAHVLEFKENLRVVLIGSLFIVLAARLRLEQFASVAWSNLAFVIWLILVVRPAAVWLSTLRSDLTIAERCFLAWFAPRGIVAAAVSSVFALKLGSAANGLVETTFLVVVCTVAVYGLSAPWLARRLGFASAHAQGLLIVGAHEFSRELATVVRDAGIPVLLVDTNRSNVHAARMANLPTFQGNALAEGIIDDLNLGGLGRMLALTDNDEVNTLAAQRFAEVFGRSNVFQLIPESERDEKTKSAGRLTTGRFLFGEHCTYDDLVDRHRGGAKLKKTRLSESFDFEDLRRQHGSSAVPLFIITEKAELRIATPGSPLNPKPGEQLVSLVSSTQAQT